MSDVIYRQDAIDAVMDLPDCENGYSDTYDKSCIIGVIEDLPSAQQWIPCSERLPEQSGFYLVTYNWFGHLSRSIQHFDGYDFKISTTEIGDVTAWMPLPEPYKEEN